MPVSYYFSCKDIPHKLTSEEVHKCKDEDSNFLGVAYSDNFILVPLYTLLDIDKNLLDVDRVCNIYTITIILYESIFEYITNASWIPEEAKEKCKKQVGERLQPFLVSKLPLLPTDSLFCAAYDDGSIQLDIKKSLTEPKPIQMEIRIQEQE